MKSVSLTALLRKKYLAEKGYGSGKAFTGEMLASVTAGDVFCDLGCGEAQLRQQMPAGVRYLGLDRYAGWQNNEYARWHMRPDIVCDVHQLPLASASCKSVALLHVLEHAADPHHVFSEIFRVLVPGGLLFVDVPFFHQIHHAPHDYLRCTPFYLRELARQSGFTVVSILPSGGYFRALSHILRQAPGILSGSGAGAAILRCSCGFFLLALGVLIEKLQYILDLYDNQQNVSVGYHCVYRKSEHA